MSTARWVVLVCAAWFVTGTAIGITIVLAAYRCPDRRELADANDRAVHATRAARLIATKNERLEAENEQLRADMTSLLEERYA